MDNAKEPWTDVEDRGPGCNVCPLRVPEEEREGEKEEEKEEKKKRRS